MGNLFPRSIYGCHFVIPFQTVCSALQYSHGCVPHWCWVVPSGGGGTFKENGVCGTSLSSWRRLWDSDVFLFLSLTSWLMRWWVCAIICHDVLPHQRPRAGEPLDHRPEPPKPWAKTALFSSYVNCLMNFIIVKGSRLYKYMSNELLFI